MTNPATNPRFRLAPGVVLTGGRRPPLPSTPAPPSAPGPADTATAGAFRNTTRDRAALAVSVDPAWLLAPLYARDAAGLTPPGAGHPGPLSPPVAAGPQQPVDGGHAVDAPVARGILTPDDRRAASEDWPSWWAGALAYRPGTPAPRPQDLFAGSSQLSVLWPELREDFRQWLAARPTPDRAAYESTRSVEVAALAGFTAAHDRNPGRWTVRILQIPVSGDYLHSPEPRRIVISAGLRSDPERYAAALAAELPRHF